MTGTQSAAMPDADQSRNGSTTSGYDRRRILLIFAGLLLTMLLASLDQMIFSTALPTIVGELNGVDRMLWVTTAYLLASTIMLPIYGKVGDQIGRKPLLIFAIAVFMAGSVLGGLASDMTWLILGRSVQGLGGGGLLILAQAIIADVVPARSRGRYMGIMGGVFAVSSVAGPLLGGFFTEGIGWRWAFWMNLPLGTLSIASAIFFLRLPTVARRRPALDVPGMVLMAVASTGLVLVSTWGGTSYAWVSPVIIGLIVVTVAAAIAFIRVERSAAEPIMPLHLFRDRNFDLTTIAGLIMGISMFGALAYIPTFLQMVTGANATRAGFLMIPMMGGLLITSILAGQLVSRTGRYKILPVIGSAVVAAALALLSTMNAATSVVLICTYLAVMGIGLGMSMQILILVVQNSFPITEVGTATAASNYFRQIGAALGSAVVGTLFVSRLTGLLAGPADAGASTGRNSLTPEVVRALPATVRQTIINAYSDALTPIFLYMVPLMVAAVVLLLFVNEKPLATTIERDIPATTINVNGGITNTSATMSKN